MCFSRYRLGNADTVIHLGALPILEKFLSNFTFVFTMWDYW